MESVGATWLASYPKSGNTWLRCLLDAYRCNGFLDINDVRGASSDGGAILYDALSPAPLSDLGFRGQMLLRPAVIMHLMARLHSPRTIKTHFANVQPEGLPHMIPRELTDKAVYVVRDPRDVLISACRFFGMSPETGIRLMGSPDATIGGTGEHITQYLSSWSTHVASWVSEKSFPVHVVRYEDMVEDSEKELTEVLEFFGQKVDAKRVRKAAKACDLRNAKQQEAENGFTENASAEGLEFFRGSNWRRELGERWIEKIEEDHGQVMVTLGYELTSVENIVSLRGA